MSRFSLIISVLDKIVKHYIVIFTLFFLISIKNVDVGIRLQRVSHSSMKKNTFRKQGKGKKNQKRIGLFYFNFHYNDTKSEIAIRRR